MDSFYPQAQVQPQQSQYEYVDKPATTDEIYAKELQQEIARNIVAQINPDVQLFEIEQKLRGKRKDYETGQWVQRETTKEISLPLLILIDDFMAYLSSIMNQSTSLSNLSDNEINKIMHQAIEWIVDALEDEKYGVYEYTERTRIGHIILNPMFIIMKRAMFGQESKRMWKSLSISDSVAGDAQQKKPNWLDGLKFWK